MNTGEIIKYFRLARNMTQEQLAQDAEISFSTLRKYEANERNPKYEQLSKIADALGISVNLFMDFDIQSVSDLFSILCENQKAPILPGPICPDDPAKIYLRYLPLSLPPVRPEICIRLLIWKGMQ